MSSQPGLRSDVSFLDWSIMVVIGTFAWCNLAGWFLSMFKILNMEAYVVLAAFTLGLVGCLQFSHCQIGFSPFVFRKHRFRDPSHLIFLACAFLTGLAGILYAPNNYDALTYRLPRILHWLAQGHWYWIETVNERLNYSGTGQEWICAPFIAILHTDRLLFLTNWIPFLLLPSLIFATFTRLGVSSSLARAWMWLFPTAFIFVLQAGSIGNDTLGGFYLLAGLYLALRSLENGRISYLLVSAAAISLLTSLKASNLPLVLPWLGVLWPARKVFGKRLVVILPGVLFLAVFTSAFPTLFLNYHYTSDWTGDATNMGRMKLVNPIAGLLGNSLQALAGFLQPPVFPFAASLNKLSTILPEWMIRILTCDFPRFEFRFSELPQEESAGIGLPISICVLWLFVARKTASRFLIWDWKILTCLSILPCLCVYFAKFGSESTARLISPYYPLLMALILRLAGNGGVVRTRKWKNIAYISGAMAIFPIVLTPSRPLLPLQSILNELGSRFRGPAVVHAQRVYDIYRARNHSLGSMLLGITENEDEIGLIALDDAQTGLWQPYGQRRIIEITPANVVSKIRTIPVIASNEAILFTFGMSSKEFCNRYQVRIANKQLLSLKAGQPATEWFLFHSLELTGPKVISK